jgi:endonuclease/exonuclease/phosphatase family metal-dependent hydrolase
MCVLSWLPLWLSAQVLIEAPVRVMSFNIRYDTPSDGYHAWPHRRELVGEVIRLHDIDLLGLQEVLPGQITDLLHLLPEYAIFGVARDTGRSAEFVPICYRRSRLQLLDGGTFWLSATPNQMSRGWDAAIKRIVTWAKFEDRQTKQQFLFFNTHFDHRGVKARAESAHLLLRSIAANNPQQLPVLVSGDFNAEPSDIPYQLLTTQPDTLGLRDTRLEAQSVLGPEGTWAGFTVPRLVGGRIDYLFCQHHVAVLRYATLTDGWDQQLPSDHLPIMVEVLLGPTSVHTRAQSHHDYQQPLPLIEALDRGFNQVEVKVWLDAGRLLLLPEAPRGSEVAPQLERLYLEPLARRVQAYRGQVFPGHQAPFVLTLELVGDGGALYQQLRAALTPYRWMMTGADAPVVVLLSGERSVQAIFEDSDRFMAIDGTPSHLGQGFSTAFMPLISEQYDRVLAWRGEGVISGKEQQRLQRLVEDTHAEGKTLRLWDVPEEELVWQYLLDLGVDVISTDHPRRLQQFLASYAPTIDLSQESK